VKNEKKLSAPEKKGCPAALIGLKATTYI